VARAQQKEKVAAHDHIISSGWAGLVRPLGRPYEMEGAFGANNASRGFGCTITCRASQRGMLMRNVVLESRSSGLRYLEINGQRPAGMGREGLGFWSPSLPARAGDTFDIRCFVRGKSLKPARRVAIAGFGAFTHATGQHRRRIALPAGVAIDRPLTAAFEWTKLSAAVKVPHGRETDESVPWPGTRQGHAAAGRDQHQGAMNSEAASLFSFSTPPTLP
jgi:hypothetical protein